MSVATYNATVIPQELQGIDRWVCWSGDPENKRPLQSDGTPASSTEQSTWTTFPDVIFSGQPGIGFVLIDDDDVVCIDLDGCRHPDTGETTRWAQAILDDAAATYAEVSPSGTGYKIYGMAHDVGGTKSYAVKRPDDAIAGLKKTPKVELFIDAGRYLCVTGERVGDAKGLADISSVIKSVRERYGKKDPPPPDPPPPKPIEQQGTALPATASASNIDPQKLGQRIAAYIAKMPIAVSGDKGSWDALAVARVLYWGFGLSIDEARPYLMDYSLRCDPPWSDKEIEHKLKSASDWKDATKPRGYLLQDSDDRNGTVGIELSQSMANINAAGDDAAKNAKSGTPEGIVDFGFIDSAEFATREYETTWLVDYMVADQQPMIIAGPMKSLKTTTLIELCVSVASGEPFFSDVPTRRATVAIVSVESGEGDLQETAERICRSKGTALAYLGSNLRWAFKAPNISRADHIVSLAHFIKHNAIEVLAIDPAYLTMGIGDNAANQFAVGEILANLTELSATTGVLPILAAHTRMHQPVGTELSLSDIAYSGFGQWARQWFLVNRREKYDPERPGHHELFLTFGGSAGHSGSWALDIDEGSRRDGRGWEYQRHSATEVCRDIAQAAAEKKEQRYRDAEQRKYESRRAKIVGAIKRFPNGETEKMIRDASGLNGTVFQPVWLDMLEDQTVLKAGQLRKGNNREYDSFIHRDHHSK